MISQREALSLESWLPSQVLKNMVSLQTYLNSGIRCLRTWVLAIFHRSHNRDAKAGEPARHLVRVVEELTDS
jgi:hypothetical protein